MKHNFLKKVLLLVVLFALIQAGAEAAIPRSVMIRRQKENKILVVATTATLADIAHYIGGQKVYVTPLTEGYPPESEPKSEYRSVMAALKEAHVLLRLGKAYDPWIEGLAGNSGNARIASNRPGNVDTSAGIADVASSGCGHASYYWLDPENGKKIASNILAGLENASPKDADYFRRNYGEFVRKIDESMPKWQARLAPYKGARIISCCDVLSPFEKRFGLVGVELPETVCARQLPASQVSEAVAKISS
ncbi:MAG: metal ABC transporter substrate-binding protein, partial [Armatimonadetes bacterium]|nr:metal ABC transporter substrate-binding protein [Armatimonadota bacterium]